MKRILAASVLLISPASAEVLASFDFTGGSAASADSSAFSSVADHDPRSAELGAAHSAVSAATETAFMRAENTPSGTNPATSNTYHTFSITVQGLAGGETLDLTTLSLDYFATSISGTFFLGVYSDAVGYTGTGDKLATTNITSDAGNSFDIDLTSTNPVAGTAFTGLTNGQTIEFRFVFADNSTAYGSIHRLDNIVLHGNVDDGTTDPNLLANGGFEDTPFLTDWTATGVITEAGLNGSATAARLGFNTLATLGQSITPVTDFTFDTYLMVAGNSTSQSFRILLDGNGGPAVEIRGRDGNVIQVNHGGSYGDLTAIGSGAPFPFPGNQPVRIRVIGRDFGTAGAIYDLAWSEPGATTLSHAATNLTSFALPSSATTGTGISGIRFDRNLASAHSYWLDDVSIITGAGTTPAADYEFIAPVPDKVVAISGVYPHLAMTNNHNECGPGAIAPWAGDLWVVTYGPHLPSGDSSNKLYQINTALEMTARPESVGGTPANRMIHDESSQLFIGHHAIAADGTVRTIPVASMPGRLTGTARHLTDPANRIYHGTMEEGFYEVDVTTLAVTTLYVDNNFSGTPKANLPGVHGKGLYTSQGDLYYSNNGNGGTLAGWDGAAWTPVQNDNFTELTGPGGIHGSPPGDDRLWAVGWDERSLLLKLLEAGAWHDFRLPKSSYTHDADPGWFTEWPRIRQLDPGTPGSPFLMHMHGMFFDFPATFSATDFSGLAPLCSYHKMPVDYCTFDGRVVMTKNDASRFSNALAPKAQSNLWFGQPGDLADWGAPQGHGGVWLNQAVANGETSDPFLVNDFTRITLHLRNNSGASVPVVTESSAGTGGWNPLQTINVPPNSYTYQVLNDLPAEWLRLRADAAASDLTAYLLLSNPYPHSPVASLGTDRFAALADIRDTGGHSDGMIRVMPGNDLRLEFASDSGYHRIGGPIMLEDVTDASAEAELRTDAALSQDFGSDAASAWVDDGGTRFRLPLLDPFYDSPFLSGWARGFREVVTERELLNCHGTFYEVPRDNSGGVRRLRPLATHGKRITDFTSWRGLFVLTGVLDDAAESDSLVRSPSGAALWLGEVDDLWQMGEPRGTGGPWMASTVTAGAPSDPYLMYGYDHKQLELSHTDAGSVTFTVEVDFLADNTWSTYNTFTAANGETITHTFPAGFHAHWVRVTSDTATTATARFTYGPADQRDVLLDWARDNSLPTAAGRAAVAAANGDDDDLTNLAEFVLGTDPALTNGWPIAVDSSAMTVILRDLAPEDGISVGFDRSTDLETWTARPDLVAPDPDQSGVPAGFTRMRFTFPSADTHDFVRLHISL